MQEIVQEVVQEVVQELVQEVVQEIVQEVVQEVVQEIVAGSIGPDSLFIFFKDKARNSFETEQTFVPLSSFLSFSMKPSTKSLFHFILGFIFSIKAYVVALELDVPG